ncbi:MAG: glycosyltransferase family 4 protein [bacterium]
MNIVYLSSRLKAGYFGTEKFLENLITELKDDQHIFIGRDKPINQIFEDKGFEQHNFCGGFEVDGWKKKLLAPVSVILGIVEIIKFRKIFSNSDIIVLPASVLSESVFVGPWIRLFWPKKPIVQIIHKNDCPDFIAKNPFLPLAKYTWSTGGLVFVSESQKQLWESKNVQVKNNFVILNGVKIYPYQSKSDHDQTTINMGFLGRIHNDKGLKTLFKALSQLKVASDLKINFKIAGTGEDYDEIYDFYKSLTYPKNLRLNWIGYQKDAQKFYEELDLLVYPSTKEGFALVLLEAWERGLPVLTSDIKPFLEAKEFSPETEQKLIFKVNQSELLTKAIEQFLENYSFYESDMVKQNLHNLIEKSFSIKQMSQSYSKLFINLTKND